jgi:hypothetical protein
MVTSASLPAVTGRTVKNSTVQSSDQRRNFPNRLLIWIIPMLRSVGCGMRTSGNSPRLLLLMRRRSRTSRYSGQSPSSIGKRNNCFDDHPAGFTSCWTALDLRKGDTGKDDSDHLEAIKISVLRRSSCWSLCRDRVCRLALHQTYFVPPPAAVIPHSRLTLQPSDSALTHPPSDGARSLSRAAPAADCVPDRPGVASHSRGRRSVSSCKFPTLCLARRACSARK